MASAWILQKGVARAWSGSLWASLFSRQRTIKSLPVVAAAPGSAITFLRFAIAFAAHLGRGGAISDKLRNTTVGKPSGRNFNFHHMRGGPLFWLPNVVPTNYLFVGHTTCPGFSRLPNKPAWWSETRFVTPGFDYLHESINYALVPVDLAPRPYVSVSVRDIEASAWKAQQRTILFAQDPIEQAMGYFLNSRSHTAATHHTLDGRRLSEWRFRDYLFAHALPSYAKFIYTYEAMSRSAPGTVIILPHEDLITRPADALTALLTHLGGKVPDPAIVEKAVNLARWDHLAAVEAELGRSLQRSRRRRGGAADTGDGDVIEEANDPALRRDVEERLASLGLSSLPFNKRSTRYSLEQARV